MSDLEFATTPDGSQVAYRVLSTGFTHWLVWIPGLLYSIESIDLDPPYARFLRGLTEISNVVTIERQGIGASDMVDFDGDVFEQWADGIAAVLDELGVRRAISAGYAIGALTSLEFAIRYPDRMAGLVLMHLGTGDNTGLQERMAAVVNRETESDAMLAMSTPSRHDDPAYIRWNIEAGQRGASPRTAGRYWQAVLTDRSDTVAKLPDIQTRTLVLHRRDVAIQSIQDAESIVEAMPNATLRVLEGGDMAPHSGDTDALLAEIAEFVTGERRLPAPDRPITALLFTDLVDSTRAVADAGDDRWAAVLDSHDALVHRTLERHGGRLVKSTGDGILATFDTASRALSGATDLRSALGEISLPARMGVHVAEVDLRGDDIAGVGVHLAARVMGEAVADEILVSEAVVQITLGSSFSFTPTRETSLKGLEGTWNLYRLS